LGLHPREHASVRPEIVMLPGGMLYYEMSSSTRSIL
jgi:hypothetical protein